MRTDRHTDEQTDGQRQTDGRTDRRTEGLKGNMFGKVTIFSDTNVVFSFVDGIYVNAHH